MRPSDIRIVVSRIVLSCLVGAACAAGAALLGGCGGGAHGPLVDAGGEDGDAHHLDAAPHPDADPLAPDADPNVVIDAAPFDWNGTYALTWMSVAMADSCPVTHPGPSGWDRAQITLSLSPNTADINYWYSGVPGSTYGTHFDLPPDVHPDALHIHYLDLMSAIGIPGIGAHVITAMGTGFASGTVDVMYLSGSGMLVCHDYWTYTGARL